MPLTSEEKRRQRVAYLSLSGNLEEENSDSTAEAKELADTTQVHNENRNQEQPENGESTCMESTDKKQTTKILTVHRTLVKKDMIEYFKSHDITNKELIFEVINGRGTLEQGVGIGVTREVYTLFWNEFANSMTIEKGYPLYVMITLLQNGMPLEEFLSKGFSLYHISHCSFLRHFWVIVYLVTKYPTWFF